MAKFCTIEGCGKPTHHNGLTCEMHRSRLRRKQSAAPPPERLADDKGLVAKVKAMLSEGGSYRQIAADLGLSKTHVFRLARVDGPPPAKSRRPRPVLSPSPQNRRKQGGPKAAVPRLSPNCPLSPKKEAAAQRHAAARRRANFGGDRLTKEGHFFASAKVSQAARANIGVSLASVGFLKGSGK